VLAVALVLALLVGAALAFLKGGLFEPGREGLPTPIGTLEPASPAPADLSPGAEAPPISTAASAPTVPRAPGMTPPMAGPRGYS